MTIYEAMQEAHQKFKFSKSGVLYLNTFEKKDNVKPHKLSKKPFALWKAEEGRRIADVVKEEINKARVGGYKEANYEMKDGYLHFVPEKNKPKKKEEEQASDKEMTA